MAKRNGHALVADDDVQWCRFWEAYPRRVAKLDARKAWAELSPGESTVEHMIEALAWQAQQPAWTKDGGAFVPYPASWLRAQRWTDEPPSAPTSPATAAEAHTLAMLRRWGRA